MSNRQLMTYPGRTSTADRPSKPHSNWVARLWEAFSPPLSKKVADLWVNQSSSGQVAGDPRGIYATRLETATHRATQPRHRPLYPIAYVPPDVFPYPDGSYVGIPADRYRKVDPRPTMPRHRPAYMVRDEPFTRMYSRTGQYVQDFQFDKRFGLEHVTRIVRQNRPGLSYMAGPHQFATRQTWGQRDKSLVIAPVETWHGAKGRHIRSISGVLSMGGTSKGTGRERIPAVFTPRNAQ